MVRPVLALKRLLFLFIRHLGLTFAAERPPPAQFFQQVALLEVGGSGDYS